MRIRSLVAIVLALGAGCVTGPYNDFRIAYPEAPLRFSGYAYQSGATIEVRALDKATGTYDVIATTTASAAGTTLSGDTLYYWEVVTPVYDAQVPSTACFFDASCDIGAVGRVGRTEVSIQVIEVGVGAIVTFDEGGVQCVYDRMGDGLSWMNAGYACASPESPTMTLVFGSPRHIGGSCSVGERNPLLACWGVSGPADPPDVEYVELAGARSWACGRLADGSVECFTGSDFTDPPEPPPGAFTAIAAGINHACGLRADGSVECWGANDQGQLDAPAGAFIALDLGLEFSCGLRTDGTIQCWGRNDYDQLDTPAGQFVQLSAGWVHGCAVKADGTAVCWGHDVSGETVAPDYYAYAHVTAGFHFTCGLYTNGHADCWGDTNNPPLGKFVEIEAGSSGTCGVRVDGTVECWSRRDTPGITQPIAIFEDIVAGGGHSCGVAETGKLLCWGNDDSRPTETPEGRYVQAVAGSRHTCALRDDGGVDCWGRNTQGALTTNQAVPPAGAFTQIAAGGYHNCGIRPDSTIHCWGSNWADGTYGPMWGGQATPPPSGTYVQVSAGAYHTCAITTDDDVVCWGDPSHGAVESRAGDYTQVAAGGEHTCALRADGGVECWGEDGSGRTIPPAGVPFSAITAGYEHTCGLRADTDTLECWGSNTDWTGDLQFNQSTPPDGEYVALDAGNYHNCAIRKNGLARCWGANWNGASDPP